jgi:hypothetical protein
MVLIIAGNALIFEFSGPVSGKIERYICDMIPTITPG